MLTIDVGTSSVRALLFDGRGTAVPGHRAQVPYEMTLTSDGGVFADADQLLEHVTQAVDQLLRTEAGRLPIAAVAVCTFWHNVLGLDRTGQPITPVISWADTRPRMALDELRERVDFSAATNRTGCPLHASYLPAKLTWFRRTEPDRFAQIAHWLSLGEYLFLELLGQRLVSTSMASGTGLLNQQSDTWDDELLEVLGISAEALSPLAPNGGPINGLRDRWKERWPALSEAAWFPAVGDGACSNVGAACTTSKWAALMIGTSGALRVMLDAGDTIDLPVGLWRYRVDRRRSLIGGALSNGGNLFGWLERTLRLPDPSQRNRLLEESLCKPHGLTVLPFLAGERAPGWRDDARGAVTGLSLDTQPLDLLRACLEAVAYRFAMIDRLLAEVVRPAPDLIATGGALEQSPAWTQILADVFGQPVTLSKDAEASSRGAALLALEALGAIPGIEQLNPSLGRVFQPDPERHARHCQSIEQHLALYTQLIATDAKGSQTDRSSAAWGATKGKEQAT